MLNLNVSARTTAGRGRRFIATVLAFVAGIALTSAAWAASGRHDIRFDDADAALEKAAALLGAADCATSGKAQRDCERSASKAIGHIDSARADVAAAMAAADSGGW